MSFPATLERQADGHALSRPDAEALLSLAKLSAGGLGSDTSILAIAARLGARILNADVLALHLLDGTLDVVGAPRSSKMANSGRLLRWADWSGFRDLVGRGLIIADGWLPELQQLGLIDSSVLAVLVAPVSRGDQVIGAVVAERSSKEGWAKEDLAAAESVAELMGLLLSPSTSSLENEEFQKLAAGAVDGFVLIDLETGALLDANPAFRRLVGVPEGDLNGFVAADLLADPSLGTEQFRALLLERGEWRCETSLRFLCHPPVDVELNAHVVTFSGRLALCALVRDLAPRRRAQRLERDRAAALELIARNQPLDAILGQLKRMVESHCPGAVCSFVLDGEPDEARADAGLIVLPILASDGKTHGALISRGVPETDSSESLAVFKMAATLAGISLDQHRLNERLAYQAQHDVLTGLPNRRLFEDRMRFALATARRRKTGMALFYVDLDRFKPINDTLGHATGDRLLRGAAERIASAVRSTDTVARMGGDEFTIILQDISGPQAAARVAQKVIEALRAPFSIAGNELVVSSSIGIALYPQDGADSATLQRHADVAMYRAKSTGGDGFRWFTAEMNEAASERHQFELQLRRVIEKGELSLFYQTQVSLDGATHAVEAFVRWHHPQLGFVLPAHFIPVAEECGLIVPIGTWVLKEACRQLKVWQGMGAAPDKLSINISSVQFAQPDFVETVAEILKDSNVDPARIELEVTESLLMRNFDKSIERLAQLRAIGVSIAIDDFGTGQFALSHLHQLPVDALKVDRSFVKELGRPGNTQALVETIMALAKSLHLRVVAEGVESEEQLAILRSLGCDRAQGYLFGPAVMATELLPKLRSSIPPPRRQQDGVRERMH